MNYQSEINHIAVDRWNKENPEEAYSYEECAKGLEKGVYATAEALVESFLEKMDAHNYQLEPEYFDYCGDAVTDTEAIDFRDFEHLVRERISTAFTVGLEQTHGK